MGDNDADMDTTMAVSTSSASTLTTTTILETTESTASTTVESTLIESTSQMVPTSLPIFSEPSDCTDVTIVTYTQRWGSEISWEIAETCTGSGYASYATETVICCLSDGEYMVECYDSYGDGWNGAYLEIDGVSYCAELSSDYMSVPLVIGDAPVLSEVPTEEPTAMVMTTSVETTEAETYMPTPNEPTYIPTQIETSYMPTQKEPTFMPTQIETSYMPTQKEPTSMPTQTQTTSIPTSIPTAAQTTSIPTSIPSAEEPMPEYAPEEEYDSLAVQIAANQAMIDELMK